MRLNVIAALLLCLFSTNKMIAQTLQTVSKESSTKKTVMKEFIFLVRVPADYTTEQAKTVNPKWNAVTDKWKADGVWVASYVFPGNSFVVSGAEKNVKNEYTLANNLKVVSTIILKADTMETALELAKECPILAYGGSIEVREVPAR